MPFGAPADPYSTMRDAGLLVLFFACSASWNHSEVGSKSCCALLSSVVCSVGGEVGGVIKKVGLRAILGCALLSSVV